VTAAVGFSDTWFVENRFRGTPGSGFPWHQYRAGRPDRRRWRWREIPTGKIHVVGGQNQIRRWRNPPGNRGTGDQRQNHGFIDKTIPLGCGNGGTFIGTQAGKGTETEWIHAVGDVP
jgi:hypothetical protein